jgi:hypothetical protein
MAKCSRCGADEVKEFSAEFDFALPGRPSVYALERPAVCLTCGFSVSFGTQDTLTRLTVKCGMCGSNNVKAFSTEIVFGRGLAPPVHMGERPIVSICLECGYSEFSVPEDPLTQLRNGVPPQSIRSVSDTQLRRKKRA